MRAGPSPRPSLPPTYLPESAGSVYYLVTEVFGPHIVGRDYETAADLNRRLDVFKGNSFAKACARNLLVDVGSRSNRDAIAPSARW